MTEKSETQLSLQEYCALAAAVLRSSQAMVQQNWDICEISPDENYYDEDWTISLDQEEAKTLMSNLSRSADLFDRLSEITETK